MSEISISEATSHPLAKYRNHLEFNGYRVEEIGELLYCRHSRKSNLILKEIIERGVLVSLVYTFQPNLNRFDVLEYLNHLNAHLIFMKAYMDQDSDLILETFFEGDYDRTNFSILLDNIEYDMRTLIENNQTPIYLR